MAKKVKTFVCPNRKCSWKFVTMAVDEDTTAVRCCCGCTAVEKEEEHD